MAINSKFKLPIRTQITVVFAGILLISFFFNFVINNIYLEEYYFQEKEKLFYSVYEIINDSEYKSDELYQICVANNISLITASKDLVLDTYIATHNQDMLTNKYFESLLNSYIRDFQESEHSEIIRSFDNVFNCYFLEMFGTLNNGNYFLMRLPVPSIMENIDTINEFSYISFVICVCIGIVFVNVLSNIITYPIEKLSEKSKKMSSLDFSDKHEESFVKEIDELGQSLNNLSDILNISLQELQTANKQLEKDMNQKEQIDEMRKEFISNISHELKTPIALIQGYAEGLRECVNEDEREFYYDVIIDESQKMDTMVKQLLELTQLEFGQDKSVLIPINLNRFVENIVKNLEILLNGIDVEIISEKEYIILFDKMKLEQVLTNYLTNAIHHVDNKKQVKIFITGDEKVKLTVFNSGSHITDENMKKIWDKFFKVDKARTRTYGGSGIGLSIVAAIMRNYEEDFGVENVPDGVEFYVMLKKAFN